MVSRGRLDPRDVGWRVGTSKKPRGVELWVPYDRTTGVIGPQGSGKSLDLLFPALLNAPGGALVTLTSVSDLMVTLDARLATGKPAVVLDPFGLVPGVEQLIVDPIDGCVDTMTARRRAKAFGAGTINSAIAGGRDDSAARFYAGECAKVLSAYFHAAALTGRTLRHVLEWVADPGVVTEPMEILTRHPAAAPFWARLLNGALNGAPETSMNTKTTVHQAMELFFQPAILERCVPTPDRPATSLRDLVEAQATVYLLGREDPYLSVSPLMTAVAEDILDTAVDVAQRSAYGRLTPPWLSVLDEMPSTAPLPTLMTRMANERKLGLSFIWAAQTKPQLTTMYGENGAAALLGLTNTLVVFGGGVDHGFNKDMADLIGVRYEWQRTHNTGGIGTTSTSLSTREVPVIRPDEIRRLPDRHALLLSGRERPVLAKLDRCIDGHRGKALLDAQKQRLAHGRAVYQARSDIAARTADAVAAARRLELHAEHAGRRRDAR